MSDALFYSPRNAHSTVLHKKSKCGSDISSSKQQASEGVRLSLELKITSARTRSRDHRFRGLKYVTWGTGSPTYASKSPTPG